MNNTFSRIQWDDLVDDLMEVEFGSIEDAVFDDSKTSVRSGNGQYQVSNKERDIVCILDHQRCFVTNAYSHEGKIGHLLSNCNAGHRKLVSILSFVGC
jgi:hypothetical protein